MKCKQMVDPDLVVIDLVNDRVAGREREAEKRKLQRQQEEDRKRRVAENRALLDRMHMEQAEARKASWWRAFRSMAQEAGSFAGAGCAVLFAMGRGLVDPVAGVPVVLLCMVWTAIRVDRFVRR